MSLLYPSTAIQIRDNLDHRVFGAQCFATASTSHVAELCFTILKHLKGLDNSHKHTLRFAPGNHVMLMVGEAFSSDEPSQDEYATVAFFYSDVVSQFNWENRLNSTDRRFHLCHLMLLSPAASEDMPSEGQVMQATGRVCPSCSPSRAGS